MADTDADLPKAAVKKVVKQGLPPGQPDAQGRPRETHVNKDALLAFTEGAQVCTRKAWHVGWSWRICSEPRPSSPCYQWLPRHMVFI